MKKVDFKKELKFYTASKDTPTIVDIPEMKFLKVSGSGDPNTSQEYKDAVEALFSVAYAIKLFIEANNYKLHGKHHEIYLSDPRKASPEKLRTIIRQPIM